MTTYAQLQSMMGKNPLLGAIVAGNRFERQVRGLGDATALSPQQTAALAALGASFTSWRDQVLAFADSTDDSEGNAGTLRNLVASAARSFNRFIAGDVDQGTAMQRTMTQTMDFIREIDANNSSIPSLQDVYDATGSSLRALIVSIGSTAGEAAGSLIAAGAKAAGVKPADVGAGIGKIAVAVGLVAGAVALTQAKSIISLFRRRK